MKSLSHWAAFSQSAMGLLGCEFEWAGLASAGHLTSNGYHGNMKVEKMEMSQKHDASGLYCDSVSSSEQCVFCMCERMDI